MTVALQILLTVAVLYGWYAVSGPWNAARVYSERDGADYLETMAGSMALSMFGAIGAILLIVSVWTAVLWLPIVILTAVSVAYAAAYQLAAI